jgi:hypothetical protein
METIYSPLHEAYILRERYTFLSGTIQGGYRSFQPMDQCWSDEMNGCVPVQSPRTTCNVNKSGMCPQYGISSIEGV